MLSKSQESYVPLITLQVIMIMLSLSPMSLSLFRCTQASDSSFFVSLETLPATCFSGVDDYVIIDVLQGWWALFDFACIYVSM